VLIDGGWRMVETIHRPWRIDQHWWTEQPVSRLYYRVAPEDRPPLTVFHDLLTNEWFTQEY
jgi:hypothetical protein